MAKYCVACGSSITTRVIWKCADKPTLDPNPCPTLSIFDWKTSGRKNNFEKNIDFNSNLTIFIAPVYNFNFTYLIQFFITSEARFDFFPY